MKVKWDRDDHFLQGIENKNALLPQAGCTSSGRFYVVTPPQFMWRTKLSKRSAGEDLRWKTCTMCLVLQLLWKMNIDIYICTLYIIIYNYIYICKYTVKRQCVCVYIYIHVYIHTPYHYVYTDIWTHQPYAMTCVLASTQRVAVWAVELPSQSRWASALETVPLAIPGCQKMESWKTGAQW
jgi:hypothetical protein